MYRQRTVHEGTSRGAHPDPTRQMPERVRLFVLPDLVSITSVAYNVFALLLGHTRYRGVVTVACIPSHRSSMTIRAKTYMSTA